VRYRDNMLEETDIQRILLVEDNKDNQFLATRILERAGYAVDLAENGIEAVEAVEKCIYHVILMDIYMPEMDGFEATHLIREREEKRQLSRTPIVAFTAHAIQGYREKCLSLKMDDFITKPVRKATLLNVVDKWLQPTKQAL